MSRKILMYSFKGGAGRTVASANVAYILAKELKRRVMLIDLDIEGSGMAVLFGLDKAVAEGACWTTQDVMRGWTEPTHGDRKKSRQTISLSAGNFATETWKNLHQDIDVAGDGYLKVLPARAILSSDEEVKAYDVGASKNLTHVLKKIDGIDDSPEIILLDSASGQQETALFGLAACHILVVFVRWSRQFTEGTLQFLRNYVKKEKAAGKVLKVLVVPTAVPTKLPVGELRRDLDDRQERFAESIARINAEASHHYDVPQDWISVTDPISECAGLKWDERVLLMENKTYIGEAVARQVLEDYRSLATRLSELVE